MFLKIINPINKLKYYALSYLMKSKVKLLYFYLCKKIMTALNNNKKIYIIVHGNRQNFEKVKSMLIEKNMNEENISMASLEKAGEIGEYVAMTWPPMAAKEVIISEIVGTNAEGKGMGAWGSIEQKEIFRIPL